MSFSILILSAAALLIGLSWILRRALRSYLRFRNRMVVTCPETQAQVGVDVDAKHASITGLMGRGSLRLSDCARWPDRQACGQQCLSQIEASPERCMVRKRIEAWYEGKACAYCDKGFFGVIHWHERKPALVSPDRKLVQWEQVPAEALSEVLSTHRPVCSTCNFAEQW